MFSLVIYLHELKSFFLVFFCDSVYSLSLSCSCQVQIVASVVLIRL